MSTSQDGLAVEVEALRPGLGAGLRNHNERIILSLLRDRGPLAKSEIARELGLSAQTASVILRESELKGLVVKCPPIKGKVGKPQTPMMLNPEGAYAFGLRLGQRGATLLMANLTGAVLGQRSHAVPFPTPEAIERFCLDGIATLTRCLPEGHAARLVGLGIATPRDPEGWYTRLGAPQESARKWAGYRFEDRFARLTGLPIFSANDVNLACTGELLVGTGKRHSEFLYFYIGALVGGSVVLGGRVFHGTHGNAGAFGAIPSGTGEDAPAQLTDIASLRALERRIFARTGAQASLSDRPEIWQTERVCVDAWLDEAATSMARAALSVVAALDVTTVIVDGVLPAPIRETFLDRLRDAAGRFDTTGMRRPVFEAGVLGPLAGPLGAALHPMLNLLFAEGSHPGP